MPHPESEHGLQIQLATALRERDEAREELARLQRELGEAQETREKWVRLAASTDVALAAANARADRAEAVAEGYCHNLRATENGLAAARRECEGLRKALREISERIDSKKNPQAARARGIARAALAAPAAAAGEDSR